ncbi:hypothetical protein GQ53DRAFT_363621 [Thozetella sp. PMI_491]|nr:hypothetical protein GQ53DRAFT_363621 [Thozetella sp. PMI_491]
MTCQSLMRCALHHQGHRSPPAAGSMCNPAGPAGCCAREMEKTEKSKGVLDQPPLFSFPCCRPAALDDRINRSAAGLCRLFRVSQFLQQCGGTPTIAKQAKVCIVFSWTPALSASRDQWDWRSLTTVSGKPTPCLAPNERRCSPPSGLPNLVSPEVSSSTSRDLWYCRPNPGRANGRNTDTCQRRTVLPSAIYEAFQDKRHVPTRNEPRSLGTIQTSTTSEGKPSYIHSSRIS